MLFNHEVHLKAGLRGPSGPGTLACADCHEPAVTGASPGQKRLAGSGLMAPVSYQRQCARCHPLFFDERIDGAAPHDTPDKVRAFVQDALARYIGANPGEISKPDSLFRRVPLNFPRPAEPPARTPAEWVARRAAADERLLWNKTCAECHVRESPFPASSGLPVFARTNITARWMPRAAFDHRPHLMVACTDCHAARTSTETADVLMPVEAVCATCHSPGRAESRCFECHRYHDWSQWRPVKPSYKAGDFR